MDEITDKAKQITEGLARSFSNAGKIKSESDSQQDAVDRVHDTMIEKFE